MNALLSALLNGFVVTVPLVFLTWMALRLSVRWVNAATRYGVYWILLAVVVFVPLLYLPRTNGARESVAQISRQSIAVSRPKLAASRPVVSGHPALLPTPTAPVRQRRTWPVSVTPGDWSSRFLGLWALLAFLWGMRLAVNYLALHRRKLRAPDAAGKLAVLAQTALARMGARRRVRVAVVEDAASPMLTGPFRPAILLPAPLLAAMQDDEIEEICLHEAAHLSRYDDWALLFQRLIEAVFVLHPLVGWISRQIHMEREIACDDMVVSLTGLARPYAACLTHAAELASGFPASPVASAATDERSNLSRRVEMLLDRTRHAGARVLRMRLVVLAFGIIVLALASARVPRLVVFAASPMPMAQAPASLPIDGGSNPRLLLAAAQQNSPAVPAAVTAAVSIVRGTVTDDSDRLVTGLDQSLLRVLEDGIEQKILQIANGAEPASMSIVWALKDGGTFPLLRMRAQLALLHEMEGVLQQQRDALSKIYAPNHPNVKQVESQLASVAAQIAELERGSAVSPFGLKPVMDIVRASNPASEVSIDTVNGEQSLLDSVHAAITRLTGLSNRRKGLIVVYDEADSSSLWSENEIHEVVRDAGLPVYAIGVQNPMASKSASVSSLGAVLGLIANASGGVLFPSTSGGEVAAHVERIETEILNQYVIEYSTGIARNGEYRKVSVQVKSLAGMPPLTARFPAGHYGQ